jgi:phosphohistidine phosphatase
MRLLTLIRHAKSSWKEVGQGDYERPLNRRGERDAPRMGRRLAAWPERPQRVIASPAARAARTASLLVASAGLDAALGFDRRLYLAGSSELLAFVRELPDALQHVALVGHNPGLTDFANALADAGIENIPTCGVVRLELEVERWSEAAPGCARLLEFDSPKQPA